MNPSVGGVVEGSVGVKYDGAGAMGTVRRKGGNLSGNLHEVVAHPDAYSIY